MVYIVWMNFGELSIVICLGSYDLVIFGYLDIIKCVVEIFDCVVVGVVCELSYK